MKKELVFVFILMSFIFLVGAQGQGQGQGNKKCLQDLEIETTQDMFNNIEKINTELPTCGIKITGFIGKLIGNGFSQVTVNMNEGTTKSFYINIEKATLIEIIEGEVENKQYSVVTDETSLDTLLQSDNSVQTFRDLHDEGKIILKGEKLFNKLKVFIAKFFI